MAGREDFMVAVKLMAAERAIEELLAAVCSLTINGEAALTTSDRKRPFLTRDVS